MYISKDIINHKKQKREINNKTHVFPQNKKAFKSTHLSTCLGSKLANKALITLSKLKSPIYKKSPKNKPITNPNMSKSGNKKRKLPIMEMELLYGYKNTYLRDGKESLLGRLSNERR